MLGNLGILSRFVGIGGLLLTHGITACRNGPKDHGVIVAMGTEPGSYNPDLQVWQDCGKYWCGFESGRKPGPDNLLRTVGIDGYHLTLGDGNKWRVPMLKRWRRNEGHVSELPKKLRRVITPEGRYTVKMAVAPEHEALDNIGQMIRDAFAAEAGWSFDDLYATAAALLSTNYSIGPEEIGLLGLFDQEIALKMLGLAIDTPGLEAHALEMADVGIWVKPDGAPSVEDGAQ